MELNPNHGVTKEVHDHWHKIVAIIMHKYKLNEVVITSADMEALPHDIAVGIHCTENIRVFLTDLKTAEKLAKKEGGLPT
jgi:hypothetical protein